NVVSTPCGWRACTPPRSPTAWWASSPYRSKDGGLHVPSATTTWRTAEGAGDARRDPDRRPGRHRRGHPGAGLWSHRTHRRDWRRQDHGPDRPGAADGWSGGPGG